MEIVVPILFILAGIAVKYGKMYKLMAGYNTMTREEKARINVPRLATLFKNVMFTMAFLLLASTALFSYFGIPNMSESTSVMIIVFGVGYLVIRGNSKKYKA